MPIATPHDSTDRQTKFTDDQLDKLRDWLSNEVQSAISARTKQEQIWTAVDALYSPARKRLEFPVDGAYEYPVPIGAIACDALYAQAFDLIFSLDPPVTIRGARKGESDAAKQNVEDAKALQVWLDWKVANELDLKNCANHSVLSTTKKGTGIYYTPYVEVSKKTRAGVKQLLPRTPIYTLPVDDFLIPGGRLSDIDTAPWVGARFWHSKSSLTDFISKRGWKGITIEMLASKAGERTKTAAETAANTSDTKLNQDEIQDYQLGLFFVRYDIDGDGYDEELLVYYDIGSQTILHAADDPYDSRPFSRARYQIREHEFYGMGVVEMLQTFQEEATDTHTQRNIGMHLANTRMWAAPPGTLGDDSGTVRAWHGRVLSESVPGSIRELRLSDVYPSSEQNESAALGLAERRVGANELAVPRPSQLMGSRTPTGTATIGMAQINRRFSPAFDEMRNALGNAVKHTLYRDQEQLLAGNVTMERKIMKAVGEEIGQRVIDLLKDDEFDEAFSVELQATTANMNRDVERQNNLFLLQVLAGYYDRLMQMSQIAAQPGAPPEMIAIIKKVMESATELIQRILTSFDQMRDPESFLVRLEEEMTGMEAQSMINQDPNNPEGLAALLQGALQGGSSTSQLPSGFS